jgi:predicted O-methyltransferase YrrM
MNHFYFSIPGWFGFEDIYREAVETRDGIFVEIGAWKGRSTAFLAVAVARSGKAIDIHVVDTFAGSDEDAHRADPDIGRLRETFDRNMAPVAHLLTVHEMTSVEAARRFADGSVSFAMIDGAHDYESVKADIAAWLPKMRPGGWLAGDDIAWAGVARAVGELLPGFETRGCAWSYRVEG